MHRADIIGKNKDGEVILIMPFTSADKAYVEYLRLWKRIVTERKPYETILNLAGSLKGTGEIILDDMREIGHCICEPDISKELLHHEESMFTRKKKEMIPPYALVHTSTVQQPASGWASACGERFDSVDAAYDRFEAIAKTFREPGNDLTLLALEVRSYGTSKYTKAETSFSGFGNIRCGSFVVADWRK